MLNDKLQNFVCLLLLGIHRTAGVTHSLKYFETGSSQVPNFPEYVVVGLVDDVQMIYYDSNTQRCVPKQEWMKENNDEQYWERQSAIFLGNQQISKGSIETVKRRFNQTGGVHIVQYMYGCEWDDETGEVTGFRQHGYNGEDWLIWNMETETWVAPNHRGVISKNKWNNDRTELAVRKHYLNNLCPEWLKTYVGYGRSSLLRTDLPSVSLLQKSSSSPISCFATGFYPNRAEMFWRIDGAEIHDGVEKGEILPNNDGTFQMNVDIDLSSVPPEDWTKYECVFQISGANADIIHRLEETIIMTNKLNTNTVIIPISGAVLVVLFGLIVILLIFQIKKKRKNGTEEMKAPTPSLSCKISGNIDNSDDNQGSALLQH